jgi:hypothetical protein
MSIFWVINYLNYDKRPGGGKRMEMFVPNHSATLGGPLKSLNSAAATQSLRQIMKVNLTYLQIADRAEFGKLSRLTWG